ncbi:MAG: hypothetical protein M3083_22355 [Actinomycetota bacterium]|nr:hypothetical protein [Actinomycetota bacterium]MDQ6944790.1 hypothetical protein [Actinomycetota bacterium]
MGVAEQTLSKLAETQAAERRFVTDVTRRYDRATTAAAKAKEALDAAERARIAVLSEWTGAPGWSAERVAGCAGLTPREVTDALRSCPTPPPTEARRDARTAVAPPASAPRVSTGATPRSPRQAGLAVAQDELPAQSA